MRLLRFGVLLLVAWILVSACGGGTAPTATSKPAVTTGPSATAAPTSTPLPPPTATAVQVSTGSLKATLGSVATYALLPAVSISMNRTGIDAMYDPLIGVDKDRAPTGTSGVLSSWQFSTDGLTLSMKMRDGVTFHDGSKATTKDVKATLEWFASPDAMYGTANNARTQQVASIETPDDSTLTVKFKSYQLFAIGDHFTLVGFGAGDNYLISKAVLDTKGFKEYNKAPVGSGPFKFKSDVVNQEINYEATPRHWLYGVPKFKDFQVLIVAQDSTRTALLKSGSVDASEVPRAEINTYKKDGFDVKSKERYKVGWMTFTGQWLDKFDNGVKNPFNDVRVRRAVSLAIDRQAIMDTFMYGSGAAIMDRMVPPGDPGFKEHPLEKQDLVKAKALLAEAGYPNGFEMDMTLSNATTAGLTVESPQINEAVAVYLQALGLKVNRVPAKVGAVLTANTVGKDYTLPRMGGPGWGVTYGHIRTLAPGARQKDILSRNNEDAELETVLLQLGEVKSMPEYITLAQKFQDMYLDKMIEVPLFQSGESFAARMSVSGGKWDLGKAYHHINFVALATGKPEQVR